MFAYVRPDHPVDVEPPQWRSKLRKRVVSSARLGAHHDDERVYLVEEAVSHKGGFYMVWNRLFSVISSKIVNKV
jgi:hypothetical protein